MTALNVVAALFAVFMLVRHGPRALRILRGEGAGAGGSRGAAIVAVLNVALAVGILVMAVKGLAGALISR